jgi:uncharacterized protein YndB with AHSA1/START domain
MASHGRTIGTSASPERVWRLWSDVGTWPAWNPDVEAVAIDGAFATGTTGSMTTKAGGTHPITLTDVRPRRSFRLETSPAPLSTFSFLCEIKPDGGGSTISQSVTMSGPLGGLFSAMMGRRIAEGFQPLLAGLKSAAESGGGGAS